MHCTPNIYCLLYMPWTTKRRHVFPTIVHALTGNLDLTQPVYMSISLNLCLAILASLLLDHGRMGPEPLRWTTMDQASTSWAHLLPMTLSIMFSLFYIICSIFCVVLIFLRLRHHISYLAPSTCIRKQRPKVSKCGKLEEFSLEK